MSFWLTIFLLCSAVPGGDPEPGIQPLAQNPAFLPFLQEYAEVTWPDRKFGEFIYVSTREQQLYHICDGEVMAIYRISTSRRGPGNTYGSGKTPLGLHSIESKIGSDVPAGGMFYRRRYTGRVVDLSSDSVKVKNAITSRIMRIAGAETGINRGAGCDTFSRLIYIHGTSMENEIGQPASTGCIRMRNADVIELFDRVEAGTLVLIGNS